MMLLLIASSKNHTHCIFLIEFLQKLDSYTEGKKNDTIKKASFPMVLKLEV